MARTRYRTSVISHTTQCIARRNQRGFKCPGQVLGGLNKIALYNNFYKMRNNKGEGGEEKILRNPLRAANAPFRFKIFSPTNCVKNSILFSMFCHWWEDILAVGRKAERSEGR
jgi:hypothetical protein